MALLPLRILVALTSSGACHSVVPLAHLGRLIVVEVERKAEEASSGRSACMTPDGWRSERFSCVRNCTQVDPTSHPRCSLVDPPRPALGGRQGGLGGPCERCIECRMYPCNVPPEDVFHAYISNPEVCGSFVGPAEEYDFDQPDGNYQGYVNGTWHRCRDPDHGPRYP